jgi:hypothetical protein
MSTTPFETPKVVPAQLAFLAIYNPSLGPTDENFRDQVVFYFSQAEHARRKSRRQQQQHYEPADEDQLREEENAKLRQIGLAQGMVGFARSFANGQSMDSVETEKSRIVLKELEKGWWILAVWHTPAMHDWQSSEADALIAFVVHRPDTSARPPFF